MTTGKKFEDLTNRKSIVLLNKHIGILTKHKIKDLNKFIQKKIEDLDPPVKVDIFSKTIDENMVEEKTDVEKITELEEKEREDRVKSIF